MPRSTAKLYRRLPGRGAAMLQVATLWVGPDHLLMVLSSSIGERYKRFYFADIQAFLLRKTVAYVVWAIVLAALAAPFLFAAYATRAEPALSWSSMGGAGVFLLLLVIHLWRGATCTCHIRSAVQLEQLPSLKRLRSARRVLGQLSPLIEAAQTTAATPTPAPEP